MALIQLNTTTATYHEFSIISSLREHLKHPWLRRFIWLHALWGGFEFGFTIIEKIVTPDFTFLPDCGCGCDPFITEHVTLGLKLLLYVQLGQPFPFRVLRYMGADLQWLHVRREIRNQVEAL